MIHSHVYEYLVQIHLHPCTYIVINDRVHQSDIAWASWRLKSPTTPLFIQPLVWYSSGVQQRKYQSSTLLVLCDRVFGNFHPKRIPTWWSRIIIRNKLEQLERLRSEDTPRRLMITHTIESCWIPQVKTRSNDLEDIGQGQRSWHATHLLMLVIICTKYGKNQSRTVDATEGTRFSRSRPNDLENIGQGQSSLHARHPLMLWWFVLHVERIHREL